MSKAQIVRKSFNGGEVAPELHYRSDLETYHNACKSLKNMTVTPWGAATRRPPTELLAKIDTATYGLPVKYLPFRFSLTETFHIIFTDGSGSASSDATTADFIVFDADGNLQTLDDTSTKVLTTVYDPADLGALHHVQVNDFIYMTCGGDYPVQALSRFFDDGQGANRWQVEEFTLKFGPYADLNFDQSHTMAINVAAYDAATTYAAGDVVTGSLTTDDSVAITHIQWLPFHSIKRSYGSGEPNFGKFVASLVTSSPHGKQPGDSVTLSGTTHNITQQDGTGTNSKSIDGSTVVLAVLSENVLLVDEYLIYEDNSESTEFYRETLSPSDTPFWQEIQSASISGFIDGGGSSAIEATYVSQQDGNTGNDLSDPAWWLVGGATEGVQVASADVVSSKDVFSGSDVGRLLAIKDIADERLRGAWNSNQSSNPVNAYGSVTLKTEGGAWGGLLELQQSTDNLNTWETIGSIRSENGGSNGSIEREITGSTTAIRVRLLNWAAPTGTYQTEKCVWELTLNEDVFQLFKIATVADAKNATVETISPLLTSLSSARWKFGAFSETTGYPRSLSIHDERMVFGGTKRKPNTVWASRVNDWTNFLEGDTDVSPYTFTIKSDSFDTIRWMRSTRNLMIGTENSESTMGTRDDNSVISPTNIDVRTQTYFGSANIQAVVTADLVFFVQGQKQRVRSTQYDFGTDQYLSSEMSILAHHITKPGIKEMSFRRHPYSSIFFVLDDGKAVSFTYERDNQVKGWARMEFGGDGFIVSAASNYSDAGDIIGGIVKRGSEYTLETFGNFDSGTVYLDGQTQSDSGWSSGKALDYADTSGLAVVMDDALLVEGTDYTWSGSTLTIPGHTDEIVTVGWPFAFEIEPTDIIELGDHGAQKRISKLGLYLLDSGGCDIEVNGEDCPFQKGDSLDPGERLNGEYQISVGGGTDSSIRVKLSGDHHKPFNISAFGVYGQPSR